jgi:hypothetical protein
MATGTVFHKKKMKNFCRKIMQPKWIIFICKIQLSFDIFMVYFSAKTLLSPSAMPSTGRFYRSGKQ